MIMFIFNSFFGSLPIKYNNVLLETIGKIINALKKIKVTKNIGNMLLLL